MSGNAIDAYATTQPQPRHLTAADRRRWPLLLIGASAGTATWSGWVGLGELTGFGVVHPLPGIWDTLTVNTAITLPVGVEAYAVYALAVATDPARSRRSRGAGRGRPPPAPCCSAWAARSPTTCSTPATSPPPPGGSSPSSPPCPSSSSAPRPCSGTSPPHPPPGPRRPRRTRPTRSTPEPSTPRVSRPEVDARPSTARVVTAPGIRRRRRPHGGCTCRGHASYGSASRGRPSASAPVLASPLCRRQGRTGRGRCRPRGRRARRPGPPGRPCTLTGPTDTRRSSTPAADPEGPPPIRALMRAYGIGQARATRIPASQRRTMTPRRPPADRHRDRSLSDRRHQTTERRARPRQTRTRPEDETQNHHRRSHKTQCTNQDQLKIRGKHQEQKETFTRPMHPDRVGQIQDQQ